MSQAHDLPVAVSPAAANHTQVPNVVFDSLLAELSGAQLKVLLYIIRRLAGFHKAADRISVEQIVGGIVTRDGRRLDRGAGVARSTAIEALQYLVENGYILAAANRSTGGRDLPTTYALGPRLLPARAPEPVNVTTTPESGCEGSINRTPAPPAKGRDSGAGGVRRLDGQKKESQNKEPDSNRFARARGTNTNLPALPANTERKDTSSPCTEADNTAQELAAEPATPYSPYVAGVVLDFSQALGDALHGPANVTRTLRLWQQSGRAESAFVQECLYPAYNRVRAYQGRQGQGCIANKMAYFFEVLRRLIAGSEAPLEAPDDPASTQLRSPGPASHTSARPSISSATVGLDAQKYLHGKYAHLFGAGSAPSAEADSLPATPDLL